MGVYKEIAKADGSGITTFYRLSEENSTVETTSTGTTKTMFDYNNALNKPSINDIALVGNKTLEDLGIQPAGDYLTEIPAEYITEDELEAKDYATEAFVIDQINNAEHFHREIVDALPLTGKDNVLYLVPKAGSNKDIYDEYIWTGVDYELMGTTGVDLSDYYKKGEVDTLLDNKVTKVNGKQLSTNDYTTAEKTKLASLENYDDSELRSKIDNLHNYDDTEVKQEINQLKTAEEDIYKILDNAGESIDKKVEGIRLVKSGDSWTFYDIKGNIISFQLAKTSLGLPNTILFLEDIENDGKMTPVHYDIDEDTIHIYYTNYEGEYRYTKLQSSSVDDSPLGITNHYVGIVDVLPASANKGDIAKLSTDKTFYLYDGTEWSAFDKASEVDLSNYLAKDNTVAYKPATDYNPSTKKYVDDSIADIFIPTKVSQLTNDSGFVLKTTNDLTNYYNKSNTYNKSEVNALVAGGGGSGTSDYNALSNKPQINNVEIKGNISLEDLGLIDANSVRSELAIKADNLSIVDDKLQLMSGLTPIGDQITVSVSGNEVVISPEQPTGEDWKLWIDSDEVQNLGSEVVDTLDGNETNKAPSVNAVNNALNNKPNIENSYSSSKTDTYNCSYINENIDNKLDKDSVKNDKTESTTDTYSCNYANGSFMRKNPLTLTDMNSYDACRTGFYTGNNVANAPVTGYVTWLTLSHDNNYQYCTQICTVLGSAQIYVRYRREDSFGSWNTLIK